MTNLERFTTGQPGVYRGIPADVYHAHPGVSASRLQKLTRSPMHLRHAIDHPGEADSPALAFGRACHAAILEPEVFAATYAVAPEIDRRTKEGKAAYAAFAEASAGREEISAADFAACHAMAEAVRRHPVAGRLLGLQTDAELSALWRDDRTGLLCKLRADAVAPRVKTVVDLKTTEDASPEAFGRSVFAWGYYRQAAFYLDGLAACGLDFTRFAIVAVEKKPPHGISVYQMDEEAIDYGRREYRALMGLYKHCVETNTWPGYPPQVQTIGLPAWARRRLDEMEVAA